MLYKWISDMIWGIAPYPFINFVLLLILVVWMGVGMFGLYQWYRTVRDLYQKTYDLLNIVKEYVPILRAMKERSNEAVSRVERTVDTVSQGAELLKKVVEESRSGGVTLTTPHVTVVDGHSDEWHPGDPERRKGDSGVNLNTPETTITRPQKG